MNICIVSLDSPLQGIRDGITSHVDHVSRNIADKGHKIWIIGLDQQATETRTVSDGNVTYIGIPCRKDSLLQKMYVLHSKSIPIIRDLDEKVGFDVFHGHGGYISPISSYSTPKPKILTLHNTYEYDKHLENDYTEKKDYLGLLTRLILYPAVLLNLYRKWYYDSVDHIISVSQYNADVTSDRFNIPESKFTVIPNGFDDSELQYPDTDSPQNQILYFGRLEPHKGVQTLIDSINILRKRYPGLECLIAGDGEYRDHLENQILQNNLSTNFKFLGRLDRDTLFKTIQSSSIVVIPSFFEGIPVALFEAAAMKKPIIISKLPGIQEILDSDSCRFFEPGDALELSNQLEWMIENPDDAKTLGLNANKKVTGKYNWESIANNTITVYENNIGVH